MSSSERNKGVLGRASKQAQKQTSLADIGKITLSPATFTALLWAREQVTTHHYLHTAPDPRTRPFCYLVHLGCEPIGCLWFGRPEATRCYRGCLTYGSMEDVQLGRAQFDRWEVLCLSRVWLSPDVQPGGRLFDPARLPGYIDRKGVFRSCLASTVVRMALDRIGFDYLLAHPPCFIEQPYRINVVMSYCNIHLHRGVIYRSSNFTLARCNKAGIETWWTEDVEPLSLDQDADVRHAAATSPRSIRIREQEAAV